MAFSRKQISMGVVIGVATGLMHSAQGAVIHVSSSATGANDGTSWDNAFLDLHDALAVAQPGDEIWVAAGTYRPDRGTGDRTISFEIVCGTQVYGGFGGGETRREERDWDAHETILSGDLNGDDGIQDCAEISSCCRDHTEQGCDDAKCQNIVCGRSPQCCQFGWDNVNCASTAQQLCCHLGNWKRCDNAFEIVRAYGCESSTMIDGFTVHSAYYSQLLDPEYVGIFYGAGLRTDASELLVSNFIFRDNLPHGATNIDGGLFNQCTFDKDYLVTRNGLFIECEFSGPGSTVSTHGDSTFFDRCTLRNSGFAGISVLDNSHTIVRNSFFAGGQKYALNVRGLVTLEDSTIEGYFLEGILVDGGRVEARRSTLRGNRWAVRVFGGSALLENCLLADNRVPNDSYFLFASLGGRIDIVNSTLARNLVPLKDGREIPATIQVYNSNSGDEVAQVVISNSILWAGDEYEVSPDSLLREALVGPSYTVNNSIIQGWAGAFGGVGNSGASPNFVDPDGPDDIPGNEDDDFRLTPGSPAINAGDPDYSTEPGETDFDGHARVLCGAVDMGAYESGFGDGDCDGIIKAWDFAVWVACAEGELEGQVCETMDSDADGDIDLKDFAAIQLLGQSPQL